MDLNQNSEEHEINPKTEVETEQNVPMPPFASEIANSVPEKKEPTIIDQIGGAIKETLETIIPAIVIALLINLFLAQATKVYGQSMEPNLHTNERLIVEKVSYKFHSPVRDDIVVVKVESASKELLIKRIIGLPGETVQVQNGQVLINGLPLDEPYLARPTLGTYGPIQVPTDHVFVMGDNRNASNDSRAFGPVAFDKIVGRAWVSYWPLEEAGMVH